MSVNAARTSEAAEKIVKLTGKHAHDRSGDVVQRYFVSPGKAEGRFAGRLAQVCGAS